MRKIFSFQSGEATHFAVGELIAFPDIECFRIELTHPLSIDTEHRFDCLRMLHANTHIDLSVEQEESLIIRLTTRHRGLVNIVFVIRDGLAIKNPILT